MRRLRAARHPLALGAWPRAAFGVKGICATDVNCRAAPRGRSEARTAVVANAHGAGWEQGYGGARCVACTTRPFSARRLVFSVRDSGVGASRVGFGGRGSGVRVGFLCRTAGVNLSLLSCIGHQRQSHRHSCLRFCCSDAHCARNPEG